MRKQLIQWLLRLFGEDLFLRELETEALKKALKEKDEQLENAVNKRPGDGARGLRDHDF